MYEQEEIKPYGKGEKAQQLLQDPVIGNFEDELIEYLCHLHGKKSE